MVRKGADNSWAKGYYTEGAELIDSALVRKAVRGSLRVERSEDREKGSEDPEVRGSEDPEVRGSEDPEVRGSEDPEVEGSEDPVFLP